MHPATKGTQCIWWKDSEVQQKLRHSEKDNTKSFFVFFFFWLLFFKFITSLPLDVMFLRNTKENIYRNSLCPYWFTLIKEWLDWLKNPPKDGLCPQYCAWHKDLYSGGHNGKDINKATIRLKRWASTSISSWIFTQRSPQRSSPGFHIHIHCFKDKGWLPRGAGEWGASVSRYSFSFTRSKEPWRRMVWWLHNIMNAFKTTEVYTSKWFKS